MFVASDSHVSAFESSLPVEWLGGQNTFNNDDTWEQGGGGNCFFFYLITVDKCRTKGGKTITQDGISVIAAHSSIQLLSRAQTATLMEVCRDVSSCTTNFMQIKCVKLQLFGLIKGLNWSPRGFQTMSLTSMMH